jgi:hypothetical protein
MLVLSKKNQLRELLGASTSQLPQILFEHSNSITGKVRKYENFSESSLEKLRKIYINIMTYGKLL